MLYDLYRGFWERAMKRVAYVFFQLVLALSLLTAGTALSRSGAAAPILIGLDADMSLGTAQGGEAIRRGVELAIDEINTDGGLLGRELKLVVRDHRGNPARGYDNISEFGAMKDILAVVGGIHTPVALHELKAIHENKLIYLGPWAAGTPVVDNGFDPNYVFRVSVRDAFAGGFMVEHALAAGKTKLGLLFERTGWGRSNEQAVKSALAEKGLVPVGLEWFNRGIADMGDEIERLYQKGAEAVILVSTPNEGGVAVKSMVARMKKERLPIISHWGISGGTFYKDYSDYLNELDFVFLQTFSFFKPPKPEHAHRIFTAYQKKYPKTQGLEDVFSPVGTAHAYDLVHLLARAVTSAGTTDREKVRDALENIRFHDGLMKDYAPPFTKERHDALDAGSFLMTRFSKQGVILPVTVKSF